MIPHQLKDMRFLRVKFKDKRPFESGWQKNPYTYNEIQKHFPKENYGVQAGSEVRLLDDDTPNKGLITLYNQNFPQTMRVRDHLYFKFDNGYGDKIVFSHPYLEFEDSKGNKTKHMGELQGEGTMCVGPGSTHPSGETYDLIDDLPIQTISYTEFIKVFGEYIPITKEKIVREHKPSTWIGDKISDIPIGNIMSFNGMRHTSHNCLQGPHPIHGSSNGMNFMVNEEKNTWICFRCSNHEENKRKKKEDIDIDSRGCGGPSELIAVMEGILECHQVGSNCYSQKQAQEVIKVAREKYGLTTPEPKQQDLGEIRGWANSVSIVKLAKKHNFENCHICNNPFQFKDSHGMYYCKTCRFGGGLTKFASLISKKISLRQETEVSK